MQRLKQIVLEANLELYKTGLVIHTWGNVSGIDRTAGLVAIKPSGVAYEHMKLEDIVIVDLYGRQVEGNLKPSMDLYTHLALYRAFQSIGGVVHTHSTWATCWAQAGRDIPALGTTHADHFYGDIPCTRELNEKEVAEAYEVHTGNVIVEAFQGREASYLPAVLVKNHGPFCWGKDAADAVYNAQVLEEVAKMALQTIALNPSVPTIDKSLLDKHFLRKHGEHAYYGQSTSV